jgi:hypothetical protein
MTFPRTSVGSGTTKVSSQALPFTVTDIDMWDTVAAAIINQPDVTWQMTGDASLTANFGGIKLTFGGIPFDKSVTLLGLDGLQDVVLSVFDLTQSTVDDIVVVMDACLFNPSFARLDPMGDLRFTVVYQGIPMGDVYSNGSKVDITFEQKSDIKCCNPSACVGEYGYNSLSMRGVLDPEDQVLDVPVGLHLICHFLSVRCDYRPFVVKHGYVRCNSHSIYSPSVRCHFYPAFV